MVKLGSLVLLLACLGSAGMASDTQSVQITVMGVLHENKNGFYFKVDGMVFEIARSIDRKSNRYKFYTGVEGDTVKVTGELQIQTVNAGRLYMVIHSDDIVRLNSEKTRMASRAALESASFAGGLFTARRKVIHAPFVYLYW